MRYENVTVPDEGTVIPPGRKIFVISPAHRLFVVLQRTVFIFCRLSLSSPEWDCRLQSAMLFWREVRFFLGG